MNEDDKKWLYDRMKKSGVNISYEQFNESMNNEDDRRWYYDRGKKMGLELGSYYNFNKMFSSGTSVANDDVRDIRADERSQGNPKVGYYNPPTPQQDNDTISRDAYRNAGVQAQNFKVQQKIDADQEQKQKEQARIMGEQLRQQGVDNQLQQIINDANKTIDDNTSIPILGRFFGSDEVKQAYATRDKAEQALETMNEAKYKDDGFFGKQIRGIFSGILDSADNLSTWDFGASEIANGLTVSDVVEKYNKGEKLTASEQKLLDVMGLQSAVQTAYQDDLGIGYQIGQSLPESLGFMASMAVNPAGGIGKAAGKAAMKSFVKKYGANAARDIAGKLAIGAARAGGDIAAGAVITATTGAGQVAADYLNRKNGQSTFDVDRDGRIIYGGQVDQEDNSTTAIMKAFGNQFVENYTEMLGENFDAIDSAILGITKKGANKVGLNKLAQAIDEVPNTVWAKAASKFSQKAHFDGTIGEIMEEEIGMVLNQGLGIEDTMFERDENGNIVGLNDKSGGMFNLDTQLTTIGSVALMEGAFKVAGHVGNKINDWKAQKKLQKDKEEDTARYDKQCETMFGVEWGAMKESLDGMSGDEGKDYIESLVSSGKIVPDSDEYKAVVRYWSSQITNQAMNRADLKDRGEKTDFANKVNDAYDAGYGMGSENFHRADNELKEAQQKLSSTPEGKTILDTIDRNIEDSGIDNIGSIEKFLDAVNPQYRQLAEDYIYKRARLEGINNNSANEADKEVDNFRDSTQSAVNPNDGTITTAKDKDGNIVYLTNINDDKAWFIWNPDTRKMESISSDTIDKDSIRTTNYEDFVNKYSEITHQNAQQAVDESTAHNPKTQPIVQGLEIPSADGNNSIVVTGVDESTGMAQVVPVKYDEKQGMNVPESVAPQNMSIDELMQWQDNYYDSVDAANNQQQAQAEAENVAETGAENPIYENIQPVAQENPNLVEQEEPQEPAEEPIPVDDKGKPIYSAVEPQRTIDEIYNNKGLEKADADTFVRNMISKSENDYKKSQEHKPKMGYDIDEYKARLGEWQSNVDAAKKELDYWNDVRSLRQETEPNFGMQEPKQIYEKLKQLGQPLSLEDFVLREIASGQYKFKWSNSENTKTRGLGAHLGLSNSVEERRKRLPLLSNKDGVYPEQAAEMMVEDARTAGFNADSQDIFNEILDVIKSYPTPSAMLDRCKQIAGEKAAADAEELEKQEALQKMYEDERLAKSMGMTLAEFDEWNEYIEQNLPIEDALYNEIKDKTLDEIEQENQEYERTREELGGQLHEEPQQGGSTEGGNEVLPGGEASEQGTNEPSENGEQNDYNVPQEPIRNEQGVDSVGATPVTLEYLLEGGLDNIKSTGYFLHGVATAFERISDKIEGIRNKYLNSINYNPAEFVNDTTGALKEITDAVMSEYGQEGVDILNELVSNATGFAPRVGRKMAIRIEELNSKPKEENQAETASKPLYEMSLEELSNLSGEDYGNALNSIEKMSDAQLLNLMQTQGYDESKAPFMEAYDEYDSRHNKEYVDLFDSFTSKLKSDNTSAEEAKKMLDNAENDYREFGYADPKRTEITAKIDALREYIGTSKIANQKAETPSQPEEEPKADVKGESVFDSLESAYRSGNTKKINEISKKAYDDFANSGQNNEPKGNYEMPNDIDADDAEDYEGNDPRMLAAKYIVMLNRNFYASDEYEDERSQNFIKTGILGKTANEKAEDAAKAQQERAKEAESTFAKLGIHNGSWYKDGENYIRLNVSPENHSKEIEVNVFKSMDSEFPVSYSYKSLSDAKKLINESSPIDEENSATNEEEPKKNPSGNRLVTDERYEEVKRLLKEKLKGQLNMGIDPSILALGTEMAVYHIEKGARKFADYAKIMVEEMGDSIRPYLKSFYNGARDLPEMAELSKEMDAYDDVSKFDVANFDKETPNRMEAVKQVQQEHKVEKQAKDAKKKLKTHEDGSLDLFSQQLESSEENAPKEDAEPYNADGYDLLPVGPNGFRSGDTFIDKKGNILVLTRYEKKPSVDRWDTVVWAYDKDGHAVGDPYGNIGISSDDIDKKLSSGTWKNIEHNYNEISVDAHDKAVSHSLKDHNLTGVKVGYIPSKDNDHDAVHPVYIAYIEQENPDVSEYDKEIIRRIENGKFNGITIKGSTPIDLAKNYPFEDIGGASSGEAAGWINAYPESEDRIEEARQHLLKLSKDINDSYFRTFNPKIVAEDNENAVAVDDAGQVIIYDKVDGRNVFRWGYNEDSARNVYKEKSRKFRNEILTALDAVDQDKKKKLLDDWFNDMIKEHGFEQKLAEHNEIINNLPIYSKPKTEKEIPADDMFSAEMLKELNKHKKALERKIEKAGGTAKAETPKTAPKRDAKVKAYMRQENFGFIRDYYGDEGARELAHKVKEGDKEAIKESAKIMADYISPNDILVPMPSHTGRATYTKELCDEIAKLRGNDVADILVGNERKTLYEAKKNGESIELGIKASVKPISGKNYVIIDNVIATGRTAEEAMKSIPGSKVLALAEDVNSFVSSHVGSKNNDISFKRINKLFYEIIDDDDKKDIDIFNESGKWFIAAHGSGMKKYADAHGYKYYRGNSLIRPNFKVPLNGDFDEKYEEIKSAKDNNWKVDKNEKQELPITEGKEVPAEAAPKKLTPEQKKQVKALQKQIADIDKQIAAVPSDDIFAKDVVADLKKEKKNLEKKLAKIQPKEVAPKAEKKEEPTAKADNVTDENVKTATDEERNRAEKIVRSQILNNLRRDINGATSIEHTLFDYPSSESLYNMSIEARGLKEYDVDENPPSERKILEMFGIDEEKFSQLRKDVIEKHKDELDELNAKREKGTENEFRNLLKHNPHFMETPELFTDKNDRHIWDKVVAEIKAQDMSKAKFHVGDQFNIDGDIEEVSAVSSDGLGHFYYGISNPYYGSGSMKFKGRVQEWKLEKYDKIKSSDVNEEEYEKIRDLRSKIYSLDIQKRNLKDNDSMFKNDHIKDIEDEKAKLQKQIDEIEQKASQRNVDEMIKEAEESGVQVNQEEERRKQISKNLKEKEDEGYKYAVEHFNLPNHPVGVIKAWVQDTNDYIDSLNKTINSLREKNDPNEEYKIDKNYEDIANASGRIRAFNDAIEQITSKDDYDAASWKEGVEEHGNWLSVDGVKDAVKMNTSVNGKKEKATSYEFNNHKFDNAADAVEYYRYIAENRKKLEEQNKKPKYTDSEYEDMEKELYKLNVMLNTLSDDKLMTDGGQKALNRSKELTDILEPYWKKKNEENKKEVDAAKKYLESIGFTEPYYELYNGDKLGKKKQNELAEKIKSVILNNEHPKEMIDWLEKSSNMSLASVKKITGPFPSNKTLVTQTVFDAVQEYKKAHEEKAETPKKEAKPTSAKKIEDFGEKINGARKDMLKEIAKSMDNVTVQSLIQEPFAKVFKKPNFRKLVDEGMLTEDQALFGEAVCQARLSLSKPKLKKKDEWRKSWSASYKTPVEGWAEKTYEGIKFLKDFLDTTNEGREEIVKKELSNEFPYKDEEEREIQRIENLNPGAEFPRNYTPNPVATVYKVMQEIGFHVGDKLRKPIPTIESTYHGTYRIISNGKYIRSTTPENYLNDLAILVRINSCIEDTEFPDSKIRLKATANRKTGEIESYNVSYTKGKGVERRSFETKEEADRFVEELKKKNQSYYESTSYKYVKDKFIIGLRDDLDDETVFVEDGQTFPTAEDAQQYVNDNREKVNGDLTEANRKAKNMKAEKKEHLYVSRAYTSAGWVWSVVYDDPIVKKLSAGLNNFVPLKDFQTREEAEKYLQENRAELEKPFNDAKDEMHNRVYFSGEKQRVGEDYRKGKDVTPEMFSNEFGFRGVQFGNWTNDADRQNALNMAYDAFKDMAKVLGVSPKALSLNGELGISFGARGTGKALAHYEPGEVVINITKTKGAGSLAHEWFHALDNYFSRRGNNPAGFATEQSTTENMRPELRKAFTKMMDAARLTDYGKRSKSQGEYWGSDLEIAARMFAEWVNDELEKEGKTNSFLSRGIDPDDFERIAKFNYKVYQFMNKDRYDREGNKLEPKSFEDFLKEPFAYSGMPYPTKEETKKLDPFIRKVFDTINEEVVDGKSVLYQIPSSKDNLAVTTDAQKLATDATMQAANSLSNVGINVEINTDDEIKSITKKGNAEMMAFSNSKEEFERSRDKAVKEIGYVLPGLSQKVIPIIDVPMHDFTGSLPNAIKKAKEWAADNYVGKVFHLMDNGGEYSISKRAIGKYFTESSFKNSDNQGVHIAAIKRLTDIIENSVDAEIHPDYGKDENENRYVENGINDKNLLVHRLYGATTIDGKLYRVKTTMYEFGGDKKNVPHTYEVTKIELIDAPSKNSRNLEPSAMTSTNSITGAKLLENVEKSYDKGKKLLDESEIIPLLSKNKKIYGFVVGKTIHLSKDGINPNTPVHEYAHIWCKAVKKNAPELWDNIKELIKETPIWNEVIGDENYSDIKDNEDEVVSECVSRISGRKNASKLNDMAEKMLSEGKDKASAESLIKKIKSALDDLWKWIGKNLFGIKNFDSQEDVADRVLYDFYNETELGDVEDSEFKFQIGDDADAKYAESVSNGDIEFAQKVVDEAAKDNGYTIHAYHGTGRADRVGNKFNPKRATSGPMAFFTDDKAVAEGYAKSKRDTSIDYEPWVGDYNKQFYFQGKYGEIPFKSAWGYLPFSVRHDIAEKAGHVRKDWDGDGDIIYDEKTKEANGGFQWQIKEAKGNVMSAMLYQWLESGNLYNEEKDFLKVLDLAGVNEAFENIGLGKAKFHDPNYREEKVYDVYLKIENPFDTSKDFNDQFLDDFENWLETHDESDYTEESANADMWDKNAMSAEDWIDRARNDIEQGTTHVWTSIPDVVTAFLKDSGYDGIKDEGGKFSDLEHSVYIPFTAEQVKSAEPVVYGDDGNIIPPSERFNQSVNDIRYSVNETEGTQNVTEAQKLATDAAMQLVGDNVPVVLANKEMADVIWSLTQFNTRTNTEYTPATSYLQRNISHPNMKWEHVSQDIKDAMKIEDINERAAAYERIFADKRHKRNLSNFRVENGNMIAKYNGSDVYFELNNPAEMNPNVGNPFGLITHKRVINDITGEPSKELFENRKQDLMNVLGGENTPISEETRNSLSTMLANVRRGTDENGKNYYESGFARDFEDLYETMNPDERKIFDPIYERYEQDQYDYNDSGKMGDDGVERLIDSVDAALNAQPMVAWHGSAADFDKFDTKHHMGEGEGSQVYGYGTYVSGVRSTGEMYASIARKHNIDYKEINKIRSRINELVDDNGDVIPGNESEFEQLQNQITALYNVGNEVLYKVEIPDDFGSTYLDWNGVVDKAITERIAYEIYNKHRDSIKDYRIEKISDAPRVLNLDHDMKADTMYNWIADMIGGEEASKVLNEIGYLGIKVPTGNIRGGDGRGTNYIIFNDNDLKITEKIPLFSTKNGTVYGWAQNGKIYLTERGINPNTPIHEYTHLWAACVKEKNPKLWEDVVDKLSKTDYWNEVANDPAYKQIFGEGADRNDRIASEVLSRLTGRKGSALLNQMAEEALKEPSMTERAKKMSVIHKLRDLLKRFWNYVAHDIFHMEKFNTAEDIPMQVLSDLVNGTDITSSLDNDGTHASIVTDEATKEWFDKEPKIISYKTVAVGKDGELHAPMADNISTTKSVKNKIKTNNFSYGTLMVADEHPELVDENGKINIIRDDGKPTKVAYDPYDHSSDSYMNDQFKSAWERDNLVVIEEEIPKSLIESENPYHAEKAYLPEGKHDWKSGAVGRRLPSEDMRHVYLSRYSKPIGKVSWDDVANEWIDKCLKYDVEVPFNVVPKVILDKLADSGVKIVAPENGMGQNCFDAYEAWKAERNPFNAAIDNEVLDKKSITDILNSRKSMRKSIDDFAKENENATNVFMPSNVFEFVRQLKNSGHSWKNVAGGLLMYFDKKHKAFHSNVSGDVFILRPDVSDEKNNSYLYHENLHNAFRGAFGKDMNDAINLIYDYIMSSSIKGAKEMEKTMKLYESVTDSYMVQREEAVVGYLQNHVALTAENIQDLADSSEIGDQYISKLLEYIKYGTVEGEPKPKYRGGLGRNSNVRGIREEDRQSSEARKNEGANNSYAPEEDTETDGVFRQALVDDSTGQTIFDNSDPDIRVAEKAVGAAAKQYERTLDTAAYHMREAWQDSMLGLKALQKAVADASHSPILDFENAYMAENAMSSINLQEMNTYRDLAFKPILSEIGKMMKEGAEYSDIIDYLMAKHGLERNQVLAQRDADKVADEWLKDTLHEINKEYGYKLRGLNLQFANGNISQADWHKEKSKLDAKKQKDINKANADYTQMVADEFAKNREKDYSGLTGLTGESDVADAEARAADMVTSFEGNHETADLWDRINAANKAIVDKQMESGLIDKDTHDNLLSMFKNYIPLRGFEETTSDEVYDYLQTERSRMNKPLKTAKGRKSVADDPIATIANMAESGIMQGNRNLMKQRFLTMAENHPTDAVSLSEVWLEYDPTTDEWNMKPYPVLDADATPEEVRNTVEQFNNEMAQLAAQQPDRYKKASDMKNIPYRTLNQFLGEHQVLVKRGGKDYLLTINGNPRAAQALNGLTNPNGTKNVIFQTFEKANRFMAANFTSRNPSFVLANLVRDGIYSNVMSHVKEGNGYGSAYNKNWGRAIIALPGLIKRYNSHTLNMNNKMDEEFSKFMAGGGETGYTFLKDVEEYKDIIAKELRKVDSSHLNKGKRILYKVADSIEPLANALEQFNRWAEGTSRFAAFLTSRELGRSVSRSVWDAKEISVNFNKKGAGSSTVTNNSSTFEKVQASLAQGGRELYIFFNAGMQGMANFTKIAANNKGKFALMASAMIGGGMLIPILNQMLINAFGGDDDDYYDLPEYVRRSNICIWMGSHYAMIPLPIELRSLYGLGELAYGQASGNTDYSASNMAYKAASQMAQIMPLDPTEGDGGMSTFVPSYVKPLWENHENKDWTGVPMWSDSEFKKNNPEWTKAFKSTSPMLINLSATLNEVSGGNEHKKGVVDINPAAVEHLFEGYFGGVASTLNQTYKTLSMPFDEDLREARNIPIANRFIRTASGTAKERSTRNEYFDLKEKFDEYENELNGFKRDMKDAEKSAEAQERYLEMIQSKDYMKYKMWDSMDKNLQRMRKAGLDDEPEYKDYMKQMVEQAKEK